ncbi:limulus clotting factor C [Nephila pilipes]|uniref:Limulus clotting factor C n=1 Tax=Nephila pilipes TaxID=299642 RepID=A0A8X6NQF0_NEPPI|nr:limulus clotting factor C [Nephila pilipes]
MTGWGLTENQLASKEMAMTYLPVQSNQNCLEAYAKMNFRLNLTNGQFCAGLIGHKNACKGDGGSPLVFYDSDADRYTVEGLVSFELTGECGFSNVYSVFTRVSFFMPWLLQNWPR